MTDLLNNGWFMYFLACICTVLMAKYFPDEWLAKVCPECHEFFKTSHDLELHKRAQHQEL